MVRARESALMGENHSQDRMHLGATKSRVTGTGVETWFPRVARQQHGAILESVPLMSRPCASANTARPSVGLDARRKFPAKLSAVWQPERRRQRGARRGARHARAVAGCAALPLGRVAHPGAATAAIGVETRFPHASVHIYQFIESTCSACSHTDWKLEAESSFLTHGRHRVAPPKQRTKQPLPPIGASRSPLVETRFPRFRSPHHV